MLIYTSCLSVLRHSHELQEGRTSSISYQTLGFGESGEIVNYHHEFPSSESSDDDNTQDDESSEADSFGFQMHDDNSNTYMLAPMKLSEIAASSSKLVTFIDLAGDERYLKTILFGELSARLWLGSCSCLVLSAFFFLVLFFFSQHCSCIQVSVGRYLTMCSSL